MELTVQESYSPQNLQEFILYSTHMSNAKQIIDTLLPFVLQHFPVNPSFLHYLLKGESLLSTKPCIIPSLLPLYLTPSSTELTNCLLYSLLLVIQSKGDIHSTCYSVKKALLSSPFLVDTHSLFLCCCLFTEGVLTPVQVLSCSTLLELVVSHWLDQNQNQSCSQELLTFLLVFLAIGGKEQLMHQVIRRAITAEPSHPPSNEAFCNEESVLSRFCYIRGYDDYFSKNHFLTYHFLFSSQLEDLTFCIRSIPAINDTYGIQFTLFLFLFLLIYHL